MSTDASEPVLGGVRLEQHAGVTAALAEGIALAEVLAQEEIPESKWPAADRAWLQALADSPELQVRYMQRRRQAEDALARSIRPVDDDPVAWAGLLAAMSAADDPQTVLGPLGLRMTDIGRLGRQWKKKAEADPKVVETLTANAGTAPAPREVHAAAMTLRPFPWSPAAARGVVAPAAPSSPPPAPDETSSRLARLRSIRNGRPVLEGDYDLFAAMLAVRQIVPDELTAALTVCGVDEARFSLVEQSWEDRAAASPDLRAALHVRIAEHRDALRGLLAGGQPILRHATR